MRIVPRLLLGVVVVVALSTAAVHALSVASTTDTVAATVAKILHVESSSSPEKNQQRIPTQSQAKPNSVAPAAVQSSLGPNLIANPSLETTNASGLPSAWNKAVMEPIIGRFLTPSPRRVVPPPKPQNSASRATPAEMPNGSPTTCR